MWSDSADYVPTDDDYMNAEEASTTAVQPGKKLTSSWGKIKLAH